LLADFSDHFFKKHFIKETLWKVHEGVVSHSRLTTGPVGPVYGRAIVTSPYRQRRRTTGSTTSDYSISANLVLVIFWFCATRPECFTVLSAEKWHLRMSLSYFSRTIFMTTILWQIRKKSQKWERSKKNSKNIEGCKFKNNGFNIFVSFNLT